MMIARPSSQLTAPPAISQAGVASGGTATVTPFAVVSVEGIVDRWPPVSNSGRPRQDRPKNTVARTRAHLRPTLFFHATQSQISTPMMPTTIELMRTTFLIRLVGTGVLDPDGSAAWMAVKSDDM
jgi:hypothetical protein